MGKKQRVTNYARITYETRLKIVELVFLKGFTIQKAASTMEVKASTARMILKKYKEQGTVFERKQEQKVREITEQVRQLHQHKQNTNIINPEVPLTVFIPIMTSPYIFPVASPSCYWFA